MRECREAVRQNCLPRFTGRNQSGWRYLPFMIDGVPILKAIPDEFDDSEDEEFYNAARRHRFDQLMLRRDAQLRFWRSAAPRANHAEEHRPMAAEGTTDSSESARARPRPSSTPHELLQAGTDGANLREQAGRSTSRTTTSALPMPTRPPPLP